MNRPDRRDVRCMSHRPFGVRDLAVNVLTVAGSIFVGLFLVGAVHP